MYTTEEVLNVIKNKGYRINTATGYPNIIGIRHLDKENAFDDVFMVIRYDANGKILPLQFLGTTDPGEPNLLNPVNTKGCAILVPGQYKNVWKIGMHHAHEALVQIRNMSVYRDNDRDRQIDIDPAKIDTGLFGINFHGRYTRKNVSVDGSPLIGPWSAGCQVTAKNDDHEKSMQMCKAYFQMTGEDEFDYTLLVEQDFK